MRWICKQCGAESPVGIGYPVAGPRQAEVNHNLSLGLTAEGEAPDHNCTNPHLVP